MIKKISAFFWKETLVSIRSLKIYSLLAIIASTFLQLFIVKDILTDNVDLTLKVWSIRNSLMFLAPLVIPYAGTTVLQKSIVEERNQKCLSVLFSTGLSPQLIWFGKFISASIFSYLLYVLNYFVYISVLHIVFNISNILNFQTVIYTFLIMPLISISILSILGLTFWCFKNPQLIAMIIPMCSLLLSMNLMMKFSSHTINYIYIIAN